MSLSPSALAELARKLLEEELIARRCAEGTRKLVRLGFKEFLQWAQRRGTGDLGMMGKKDIASYLAWLGAQRSKKTGEPLADSTKNGRFRAVVMAFSSLCRAGAIEENPARGFGQWFKEEGSFKRRPLTREETERFLERIDVRKRMGLRDRALYELIYSSGLRVSEAASLKVGDLDLERRVMVVRGKFDRDRTVPFSEVARDILALYLDERAGDREAWVFPSSKKASHLSSMTVSEHFRSLLRRFDMDSEDISTHSLRHSTATHLLENGASVRHVQELLGHRCIESTVRYTHVMVDGLAKVYRKHHPREHELFEALDDDYERRLDSLAGL